MGYFSELPNLQYQSPFSDRLSDSSYVFVKNIFRRMKVRDDLQNVLTVFNKYQIADGTRPDNVAEELYGESEYDYVVLLTANITNVRDQWPITNKELYDYVVQKYGLENVNRVHHYITKEIRDSDGKLILPAGKVVGSNFTVNYFDSTPVNRTYGQIENLNIKSNENEYIDGIYTDIGVTTNGVGTGASFTVTVTDGKITTATVNNKGKDYDLNETIQFVGIPKVSDSHDISTTISVKERLTNTTSISNYEYEVDENEKKRTIYILKPTYLGQFLDDMKNEMIYKESSQFVSQRLIRTENTRITIP